MFTAKMNKRVFISNARMHLIQVCCTMELLPSYCIDSDARYTDIDSDTGRMWLLHSQPISVHMRTGTTYVYTVQLTDAMRVQCTVYSVQSTVYTVQGTEYNVQCTKYSVHCTLYSVQCIHYIYRCRQIKRFNYKPYLARSV